MILTATRVELAKAFSKWRTYIAFIAVGLLIPVVIIAMGAEGKEYFGFATQMLQSLFTFTGNLMNGYTVSYILLGSLYVHVPFLVTLVAGNWLRTVAWTGRGLLALVIATRWSKEAAA